MITKGLLILGALLVFGPLNWQMERKERLRVSGQVVYLELAPVDPRSLMQGDYMALNFELTRSIESTQRVHGDFRVAVLKLDENGVGHFARMDDGQPLATHEVRFRFRVRGGSVWLGTNAFFFHEGEAERYRDARYGEFRVAGDGEAMLVDLVGKERQQMILIKPQG